MTRPCARAICALTFTCLGLLATSLTGVAQANVPFTEIASAGPLDGIWIGNELSCQVLQAGQTAYSFYPSTSAPGDCGTFVFTGGNLYAPDFANHDGTATGIGPYTAWTPVSQSAVTGTGTSSDPYTITTVADAGTTGLRLTQVDTYVVGQNTYRTDITIANSGSSSQSGILYRAGDCFFQGSDTGYGVVTGGDGPACTVNPDNSPPGPVEQWVPITPGDHYVEDSYSTVWSDIASHADFPNTCQCDTQVDNGSGISWDFTVPASGSATFSQVATFSTAGQLSLTTSKTADNSSVGKGDTDGYTITISNPNSSDVTLTDITDTGAAGFSYVGGSTTGATTSDPTVSGQTFTWPGSFTVPANGSASLHFNVTAPSSTGGPFYDDAGADASGGYSVIPTGQTAPVTVLDCGDSWTSPVSGSWSDAANWSTGAPPTSLQSACITASGTYTVTLTGNQSAAALTVGGGETLALSASGSTGDAMLTVGRDSTNSGTIELTDPDALASPAGNAALVLSSGMLTNDGTIVSDPGPAGAGSRTLSANVANQGTLEVNQTLTQSSGSFTNGGSVAIAGGQTLGMPGAYTQTAGTTSLGGGTATVSAASGFALQGGTLGGAGTVGGNLDNAGTVTPSPSPAAISVTGAYTQEPGGILSAQVTSTGADQLAVSGAATLGGALQVSTATGFTPPEGQASKILTAASVAGQFPTVTGLDSGPYSIQYNATDVTLATQSALSVSLAGSGHGTVTSSPAGISCPGTCLHGYALGTRVTLTATPSSGSTFTGWSGGGCAGTGTCTVTISSAESITAAFDAGPPPPVLSQNVDLGPVSGTVLVKRRGTNKFVALKAGEQVPVGSTIDATHGHVELTSAEDRHGQKSVGRFWAGTFVVTQKKVNGRELTILKLVGPKSPSCTSGAMHGHAVVARARPPKRRLWGSSSTGGFRTQGTDASATERATVWLTQDSCAGTLIRVSKGAVTVDDFPHHRTFLLKAPHSFQAHRGPGG